MVKRRPTRLGSLVIGATLCPVSLLCAQPGVPRLQLIEEKVSPVPAAFLPSHMSLGEGGRILLYSAESHDYIQMDEELAIGGRGSVPEGFLPVALTAFGNREVEVISSRPASLIRLTSGGGLLQREDLGVEGEIVHAVFHESHGWVMLVLKPTGRWELVFEPRGPPPMRLPELGGDPKGPLSGAYLTSVGTHLLITRIGSPFRTLRIDLRTGHVVAFEDPSAFIEPTDGGTAQLGRNAQWASLPTLPIDSCYLQTLVDTGSDRRRLVVFDASGRISSARALGAPIGFSVADVRRDRVIGGRGLNGFEVVRYRWRWIRPDTVPLRR